MFGKLFGKKKGGRRRRGRDKGGDSRGTLMKAEVTYHGTSMTMAMTLPGMPRIISEERRIGDCDRR